MFLSHEHPLKSVGRLGLMIRIEMSILTVDVSSRSRGGTRERSYKAVNER